MLLVYDLLLNFLDNYYEFYEWNKDDNIIHIKKMFLIKISSFDYENLLNKKIVFSGDFMLSIFNKCEYFNNKKVFNIPYAVLLTDANRIMGIMINENSRIIKYSSLMPEDEEDILKLSDGLAIIKLKYKITDSQTNILYKTREEIEMINYIKNDLNDAYSHHDLVKLKYLYYEYFGLESNNIEKIKQDFSLELEKEVGKKHYDLYQLIRLSKSKKGV